MLPRTDDRTLSRYLLSASKAIGDQIAAGLPPGAAARLEECALVVSRVAQQLEGAVLDGASASCEYGALLEANDRLKGRRPAAPTATSRQVDAAKVQSYLQDHALGGPDVEVVEARLLAGGRCKLTAQIQQSGAARLPPTLILRQDWDGGATETTVAGEFALLQRLADSGIRAPRPYLLEPSSSALGAPFMLMEHVPGRLRGSLFTPPASAPLMVQLAAEMGRLHSLPVDGFADVITAPRLSPVAMDEELGGFRRTHETIGLQSRIVDTALAWLEEHVGLAGVDQALIHNDLGFHNALCDGETLTAILDWELASIGHPAADLGYVKLFVEQVLPWSEFIAAYEAAGGPAIDAATLKFHTIWNAVRLYGLIMKARAALAADLVDDIEIAFACADNVMLLLSAMGAELQLKTDA